MQPIELEEKLCDIFGAMFSLSRGEFNLHLTPDEVVGWDSMGHLRLIAALEDTFRISVDYDEASEMDSVSRILQILSRKLG